MGQQQSQKTMEENLKLTAKIRCEKMDTDVVCGMDIDEKTAKYKSIYKGKIYYFCGPVCKLEFDEKPEKYISK